MTTTIGILLFALPTALLLLHYQEGPAVFDQLLEPHAWLAVIMLLITLYFGLIAPENAGEHIYRWRRFCFGMMPAVGFLAAVFHQPRHRHGVLVLRRFTIRNLGVGLLSVCMLAAITLHVASAV